MFTESEFPSLAGHPPLARGELHVWMVSLTSGSELDRVACLLSEEERLRRDRFRHARDRRTYVVTRAALRVVLGGYLDCHPGTMRFEYGRNGKPRAIAAQQIEFSVSHAPEIALIAAARDRRVGVDVEEERPIECLDEMASLVLTPTEQRELRTVPLDRRSTAFVAHWARKEALLKAAGLGVVAMKALEVPFIRPGTLAGAAADVHLREADTGELRSWSVMDLPPVAGHSAAIAVSAEPAELQSFSIRFESTTGSPGPSWSLARGWPSMMT